MCQQVNWLQGAENQINRKIDTKMSVNKAITINKRSYTNIMVILYNNIIVTRPNINMLANKIIKIRRITNANILVKKRL